MITVNLSGLDELRRELEEAERAFKSLDGTVATLRFDPNDPASVAGAIRQMEVAINCKTAPYRSNDMVMKVADGLKSKYREMIRKRRASAAE